MQEVTDPFSVQTPIISSIFLFPLTHYFIVFASHLQWFDHPQMCSYYLFLLLITSHPFLPLYISTTAMICYVLCVLDGIFRSFVRQTERQITSIQLEIELGWGWVAF